jgi:para-aminobenzoate synthetase component 1
MRRLIQECVTHLAPELLVERLQGAPGIVLLRSGLFNSPQTRYSFVTARPFATFSSHGTQCEVVRGGRREILYGDPWRLLGELTSRYELRDEVDLPFPLGGCFGFWAYDLKNFIEPKLGRRAINDLELPDCYVGFYSSLVVFDHLASKTWIVSTGLGADGSCHESRAIAEAEGWLRLLESSPNSASEEEQARCYRDFQVGDGICSNLSRREFLDRVKKAQAYIRAGDFYQVNLSQRLACPFSGNGWDLYQRLSAVSPAPFSAYLDGGDFQLASSSPELFLRLSGSHVETFPIKGTRPRSADPTEDAQLAYALKTSPKEMAELVMITDLLRNDLGKICQYGSISVPELARLERFPQVQHLVSAVQGTLCSGVTHLEALAACFPGGSITGAPKFRAMELIEELEPTARGPFTGALGYLGFNRESQLSIIIRTAMLKDGAAYFPVGAGIVADSVPEAEYDETLAKARGFFLAMGIQFTDEVPMRRACNDHLKNENTSKDRVS